MQVSLSVAVESHYNHTVNGGSFFYECDTTLPEGYNTAGIDDAVSPEHK